MDATSYKALCADMRGDILKMINRAGSGHPGGSLSAVEILCALYFGGVMNVRPEEPDWPDRDRFIISKGHGAPALYSALARRGFYPMAWLDTLRALGSPLQGHPHADRVPGLDCSSGSLGQGLSVADGLALGLSRRGSPARVYCLLGDGELQEGQVWEAAMSAAQFNISNVCAIVDWNRVQLDGPTEEIMDLGDLPAKWRDFGWNAVECPGHDVKALLRAFAAAKAHASGPSVILAHTVKGRGVSFMENKAAWHGAAPDDEQLAAALKEIYGEAR